MPTLKDRFATLKAEMPNVTQADLARATGAKPPSVNAWFTGDTKSMKPETAAIAAAIYGVNALWLATGKGPKHPQTLPAIYQPNQPIALAGRAGGGAMDLGAVIDALAAAMMQTDPVDRAAAKAYLIGLCDAPDRLDLRDKIRATLEPPPAAQKPTPETGAKRAA